MESGYLKHVRTVFERLGFVVTNGDLDWDVMWAHDYPFTTMAKVITALKPHQRVGEDEHQIIFFFFFFFFFFCKIRVTGKSIVPDMNKVSFGHIKYCFPKLQVKGSNRIIFFLFLHENISCGTH